MNTVKISSQAQGAYGIVGHVGVGHVHSHSGFVQDDSAGFAVVSLILKQAAPVSTIVKDVEVDLVTGDVTVTLESGGKGSANARRGFTPAESEIAKRAIGQDAVFTQNVAQHTFGRIYGQGALETAVALQGACSLAVMDSFKLALGDKLLVSDEVFSNKYDKFAGIVLDIDDIPVALMLVINGTNGGIGPDEDYEGNTNYTSKGQLMTKLGLDKAKTIVVESKAYIPALAESVKENQYMVRAQKDLDCTELGKALYETGLELNLPIRFEEALMPLAPGALEAATHAFANKVIETAKELLVIDSAADKTRILAELNKLVSEDAGGVTFMSNSVNSEMRGAGTLPGITTVLSMVTTTAYKNHWKIPRLEVEEANNYKRLIFGAIKKLHKLC